MRFLRSLFGTPALPVKQEWFPEDTANVRDLLQMKNWQSVKKYIQNRQAEHNADLILKGERSLVDRMDEDGQIIQGLENHAINRPPFE